MKQTYSQEIIELIGEMDHEEREETINLCKKLSARTDIRQLDGIDAA
jgi:hypothetical protein